MLRHVVGRRTSGENGTGAGPNRDRRRPDGTALDVRWTSA